MTNQNSPSWIWKVDTSAVSTDRCDSLIAEAISLSLGNWNDPPQTLSRSRVQTLIENKQILVNDICAKRSQRIKNGDIISLQCPLPIELDVAPENKPLQIIYQDTDLAIINKPSGISMHPSPHELTDTLVNRLLYHLDGLSGIGGVLRPGIVHRIDKDTTGLVVISKNDMAHQELAKQFKNHTIERKYLALIYGQLPSPNYRHSSQIGRNPNDRKKMMVLPSGGKSAVSNFRTIEVYGRNHLSPHSSLIEAKLETGRTHQIRVHLTDLKCSIIGDPVYGKPKSSQHKWTALPEDVKNFIPTLPGQMLHAKSLGFIHPRGGENIQFEAEPPEEFQFLLKLVRNEK